MIELINDYRHHPCGAEFSPCRTWRYLLWRYWDPDRMPCVFIGLNPSTADETRDDPTIRRCIRFAKDWKYGGLFMLNAYAFRETDPQKMKAAVDPLGPANLETLQRIGRRVPLVVAAWGVHCQPGHAVRIFEALNRDVHCLGKTKSGAPKHPLYLRADTLPELLWSPALEVQP